MLRSSLLLLAGAVPLEKMGFLTIDRGGSIPTYGRENLIVTPCDTQSTTPGLLRQVSVFPSRFFASQGCRHWSARPWHWTLLRFHRQKSGVSLEWLWMVSMKVGTEVSYLCQSLTKLHGKQLFRKQHR